MYTYMYVIIIMTIQYFMQYTRTQNALMGRTDRIVVISRASHIPRGKSVSV